MAGTGSNAGPGVVSEFSYYDSYGHPSLTQERHWDSTKVPSQPASLVSSNSVIINYTYDQFVN